MKGIVMPQDKKKQTTDEPTDTEKILDYGEDPRRKSGGQLPGK
ncbi:hypothetical protein ACUSIJ_22775 [Pseudochelatococcus sp. B33]